MKNTIICNAVSIYKEAPVSKSILEEHTKEIMEALQKIEAQKRIVIATKGSISGELPEEITLIETNTESGLTFGNYSAVLNVCEGEKPIPKGSNRSFLMNELTIMTPEELLAKNEKRVFVKIGGVIKRYHFPKAITPREIIKQCNVEKEVKGMFLGFPMGIIIGEKMFDEKMDLITDYIEIVDQDECVLDQLLTIVDYYYQESCGHCVFGYEGMNQVKMIVTDIVAKKAKINDIDLLRTLCKEMQEQSLCEIGAVAAETVLSALDNFYDEIVEHITKKVCKAGVCVKFMTYHILPERCIGCGECMDACEEDAIRGKKKFVHVIEQDECTQCGKCILSCEENAIIRAGAEKPKGPKNPIPCK